MSDTTQADLIRNFVKYLATSQKLDVFNYSVYVNREKNAFYVNAIPHFPIVRLKVDNDENTKSIELALKITENTAGLPPDTLDRVCTFEISVTMDEEGKLRVHTDLSKDAVFAQLPPEITEAIRKACADLELHNTALQGKLQAWYDEHAK